MLPFNKGSRGVRGIRQRLQPNRLLGRDGGVGAVAGTTPVQAVHDLQATGRIQLAGSTGYNWTDIPAGALVVGNGTALPVAASNWIQGPNGIMVANYNAAAQPAAEVFADTFNIIGKDGTAPGIVMVGNAAPYVFAAECAGTVGTPTALTANTVLVTFGASGYDGSAWSASSAAQIQLLTAGNTWSSSDHSSSIRFLVTPSGSVTLTQAARIEEDGTLYVGTTNSGTGKATGSGTVNADTGYFVGGVNVTPGQLAAYQGSQKNPTGTTSTGAAKMMGLAGSITCNFTGRVLITIQGTITNAGAIGDGANAQISFGTGTAPINGAALTGTQAGSNIGYIASTTAGEVPFSLSNIQTGFTVGTAYWLDLALEAVTGGTAVVENVTITAMEF